MNLQEASQNGFLDELSEIVQDAAQAQIILESIPFPRRGRPQFPSNGNTLEYWMRICTQIEAGCLESGIDLQPLLSAVASRYPSNLLFNQLIASFDLEAKSEQTESSPEPNEPRRRNGGFVYILVQGVEDAEHLIDTARTIARHQHIQPDNIILGMANMEGIVLNLVNLNMEQASSLARALEAELQTAGNQSARVSALNSEFRDYLIGRLFVEGPDQARFELNNIRASTRVKDIAQGVISEAYSETFGGRGRQQRNVTIDHQSADGSTERITDPNKTLHESNVQDGDTMHLAPESTAGSINIVIREEALAKARAQVIRFAETHKGVSVAANAREKPTEYTFRFQIPSFGSPPATDSEPSVIQNHEVYLYLPADFPMKAPEAFWQTDIFHPNIHPENGKVCLGVLEDHYKPGLNFGMLCQLILDIAAYRNYVVTEGYNKAAAVWAESKDGQMAIEGIGGKCVVRRLLDDKIAEKRIPRPIRIKRLTK